MHFRLRSMITAPYPTQHSSLRRPLTLRGWLAVTVIIAATASTEAASPRPPDGRRIYQKQCASCHGAKGEGVKDKYADALTGDWSVAKLTRYVAANMPEDNPETLTAAEAGAVSRYLLVDFYSRIAQARVNAARVELAHLTTPQYLTSFADVCRGYCAP
jgi:mono/diheme cytochrome c family protein